MATSHHRHDRGRVKRSRHRAASGHAVDRVAIDQVLAEMGLSLRAIGQAMFEDTPPTASEGGCLRLATAGERLRQESAAGRIDLPADLDLFFIAWAGECMAAQRRATGDDLITGQPDESLLLACFDDLRAFDLANLYITDPAAYRRRHDRGRRALADVLAQPAMPIH